MQNLIEDLITIYRTCEPWHKNLMSYEDAKDYHQKLFNKNIFVYEEEGVVRGYVEFWRITYDQFKRIRDGGYFSAYTEDIESGNICFVANGWIDPMYRGSHVLKVLMLKVVRRNIDCLYFIELARRRKERVYINLFKRSTILRRAGELNGSGKN